MISRRGRSQFQKDIGVIEAYVKIKMKASKGCGKFPPNDTLFADIWFSGVITVEET